MFILLISVLLIISIANYSAWKGERNALKFVLSITIAIMVSFFMETTKYRFLEATLLDEISITFHVLYFTIPVISFIMFQLLLYQEFKIEKKNHFIRNIIITVTIIFIVVIAFNQFFQNKTYERYLSERLMNDILHMSMSISYNQQLLDEMLESKTMSIEQADYLEKNSYSLIRRLEDYQDLARRLNRYDNSNEATKPYLTLISVIKNKILELDRSDINEIELNDEFLDNVRSFYEINAHYLQIFEDNETRIDLSSKDLRRNGVNKRFWVDLLEELDSISLEHRIELGLLSN